MDRETGPLQERNDVLVELNLVLARTRSRHGELALVTGEAGTGRVPGDIGIASEHHHRPHHGGTPIAHRR